MSGVHLRIEDLARQRPPRDLTLHDPLISIGREGFNALQLTDPNDMVSRRHAALRCGSTLEIMDLGSRNGTFLNEERLNAHKAYPVADGDTIRLGPFQITVYPLVPPADAGPDASDAASPPLPAETTLTRQMDLSEVRRYALPGREASREELLRALAELRMLNEMSLEIGASPDTEGIMQTVVQRSVDSVEAEQGLITLVGDDDGAVDLRTMIRAGDDFHLNEHIHAWMLEHREPLLLNDPRTNPAFRHVRWNPALRNLISAPLLVRGTLTGLLTVYNKHAERPFTEGDLQLLSIIAGQSAQIIENARLFEEQQELLRMQHEMQVALDIQTNLLPAAAPDVPGYDIAGLTIAAQVVGGDHFDYIAMDDGRWALCVGDVVGKGLPAALVMANLQATLRAQALMTPSVKACLEGANRLMYHSTNRRTFVTLIYGVLDPVAHRFTYGNAGHNPPYRCTADGVAMLSRGDFALAGMRATTYAETILSLAPGDRLVLYSDGVVEARNTAGDLYGEERLERILRDHRNASSQALIDAVLADVRVFTGTAPQADDITLLAVRRRPDSADPA